MGGAVGGYHVAGWHVGVNRHGWVHMLMLLLVSCWCGVALKVVVWSLGFEPAHSCLEVRCSVFVSSRT